MEGREGENNGMTRITGEGGEEREDEWRRARDETHPAASANRTPASTARGAKVRPDDTLHGGGTSASSMPCEPRTTIHGPWARRAAARHVMLKRLLRRCMRDTRGFSVSSGSGSMSELRSAPGGDSGWKGPLKILCWANPRMGLPGDVLGQLGVR